MNNYIKLAVIVTAFSSLLFFSAMVSAEEAVQVPEIVDQSTAVAEFTFNKMEQYFAAAKSVIDQYGGDVAALGLVALRVDAIGTLLQPLILGTLCLVLLLRKKNPVLSWARKHSYDSAGFSWLIPIFGGSVCTILLLHCIHNISNIWAWAGVFYPELYAVHKFILS